mgnify:FL=1
MIYQNVELYNNDYDRSKPWSLVYEFHGKECSDRNRADVRPLSHAAGLLCSSYGRRLHFGLWSLKTAGNSCIMTMVPALKLSPFSIVRTFKQKTETESAR